MVAVLDKGLRCQDIVLKPLLDAFPVVSLHSYWFAGIILHTWPMGPYFNWMLPEPPLFINCSRDAMCPRGCWHSFARGSESTSLSWVATSRNPVIQESNEHTLFQMVSTSILRYWAIWAGSSFDFTMLKTLPKSWQKLENEVTML